MTNRVTLPPLSALLLSLRIFRMCRISPDILVKSRLYSLYWVRNSQSRKREMATERSQLTTNASPGVVDVPHLKAQMANSRLENLSLLDVFNAPPVVRNTGIICTIGELFCLLLQGLFCMHMSTVIGNNILQGRWKLTKKGKFSVLVVCRRCQTVKGPAPVPMHAKWCWNLLYTTDVYWWYSSFITVLSLNLGINAGRVYFTVNCMGGFCDQD